MNPEETYTIEQFISSGNQDIVSYDSLCFIDYVNENELIAYNVLNDYLDELNQLAVTIEFKDKEYLKYLYKPKLLAYDVYGVSELYFIILYLNNIYSAKDFDLRKVRMLKKDTLEFLLSSIYNSEKENIENYNSRKI